MMDSRRQRLVIVVCLIFAVSFLFTRLTAATSRSASANAKKAGLVRHIAHLPAANASLGFGAIAAVSRANSIRREGLLLAANITELEIVIPDQPVWTDHDIEHLRNPNRTNISHGSALAWLGHLNMLRWFLGTDLETILVLEDDVDWDIRLKTIQIPRAASSIRHLLGGNPKNDKHGSPISPELVEPANYWGPNGSWEILYLGHCGDIFGPNDWNFRLPRTAFYDETLPAYDDLHPFTKDFLTSIKVPPNVRLVHKSITPLCTFGFALTRAAATRLLYDIAPQEGNGGTVAYDVRMLEACRDKGMRCYTVNPELFHHMDAPSEIANIDGVPENTAPQVEAGPDSQEGQSVWTLSKSDPSAGEPEQSKTGWGQKPNVPPTQGSAQSKEALAETVRQGDEADKGKGAGAGTDDLGRLQSPLANRAPNIRCGARSRTFYTKSSKTLEFLKEIVGRQGQCLRDMIEEDMARAPPQFKAKLKRWFEGGKRRIPYWNVPSEGAE